MALAAVEASAAVTAMLQHPAAAAAADAARVAAVCDRLVDMSVLERKDAVHDLAYIYGKIPKACLGS